MNATHRLRLFSLGIVLWIVVVAVGMEHYPLGNLGAMHSGIAGLIAGAAFMPRTMISWPKER